MYIIYAKNNCSYCVKAKQLLADKKLDYIEKNIENLDYRSELLIRYPEAKTVPQIFLHNNRIGGYEDLVEYFKQIF